MNKQELITAISEESGLSKTNAGLFIEAFQEVVKKSMAIGETINMQNFLKFEVVDVPERNGHNPRTGKSIVVSAHKKVKCTVGKGLKESVL